MAEVVDTVMQSPSIKILAGASLLLVAVGCAPLRRSETSAAPPPPPAPTASEQMLEPGVYQLSYASRSPQASAKRLVEHWHERAALLCAPGDYVGSPRSQTNPAPAGYEGFLAVLQISASFRAEAYGTATCTPAGARAPAGDGA